MSAIHDLLQMVTDIELRKYLEKEINRTIKNKKFGLVFEEHLPECTPLYSTTVKCGSTVAKKSGQVNDTYKVVKIKNGMATCMKRLSGEVEDISLNDLVCVAEFGKEIYPQLIPVDFVENAPERDLWHTLIEADNYHALQLLKYLYPKKVDCIYIDPPYNSGARDWKYNNDYVDKNDCYRHSKWIAFMKRRLEIAKHLLNPEDSVLLIAIDDNELCTLVLLLDELFAGIERQIINITINPKGKARKGRLSQVDEYLIVLYMGTAVAYEEKDLNGEREIRWPYLRRSDVESARGTTKGGTKQFYPIYVDTQNDKIVKIGSPIEPYIPISSVEEIKGTVPVFPIREDGKEMNWGLTGDSLQYALDNGFVRTMKSKNKYQPYNFSYVTMPSIKKALEGKYRIDGKREDGSNIVIVPEGNSKQRTTAWSKNLYDGNVYGTQLIRNILTEKKFSFPKSLYTVIDSLRFYLVEKKDALVVDFFAGSGTTLHAVNLLNYEDSGNRRCIMVTNNEVSEDISAELSKKGFLPGDKEWERMGICQSATWPRTKFSILGTDIKGNPLDGEYITHITKKVSQPRIVKKIEFTNAKMLDTSAKKKQLIAMFGKGKMSQALVKNDSKFIISEKHTISILFDDLAVDEWLSALKDQDHIFEFYVVTQNNILFNKIRERIQELLGDYIEQEQVKIPMSNGFKSNCKFFKLGFLDKNEIALGRQFKELIPILWMKAGSIGKCPEINEDEIPDMMILPNNNFAVLVNESSYLEFEQRMESYPEIDTVFVVTDSEAGYREIISGFNVNNTYQLYRDYLDNFRINSRR